MVVVRVLNGRQFRLFPVRFPTRSSRTCRGIAHNTDKAEGGGGGILVRFSVAKGWGRRNSRSADARVIDERPVTLKFGLNLFNAAALASAARPKTDGPRPRGGAVVVSRRGTEIC